MESIRPSRSRVEVSRSLPVARGRDEGTTPDLTDEVSVARYQDVWIRAPQPLGAESPDLLM